MVVHIVSLFDVQKSDFDLVNNGYNSKLDTIQAAILSVKLKCLDSVIFNRTEITKQYIERLSARDYIKITFK